MHSFSPLRASRWGQAETDFAWHRHVIVRIIQRFWPSRNTHGQSLFSRFSPLLASQFARVSYFSQAVKLMSDSEYRVTQQHPRTRIAHDAACLFPLCRLVAMHGAIRARRLVFTVRTLVQPGFRIAQEMPAIPAQPIVSGLMMGRAIDPDHLFHCDPLTGESFF